MDASNWAGFVFVPTVPCYGASTLPNCAETFIFENNEGQLGTEDTHSQALAYKHTKVGTKPGTE